MDKKQWIKLTNDIVKGHPAAKDKIGRYIDERRQRLISRVNNNSFSMSEIAREMEILIDLVASDEAVIIGMKKISGFKTDDPKSRIKAIHLTTKNYIKSIISKNNSALSEYLNK